MKKTETLFMSNKEKMRLICKYAKIRFKRFWKEWGIGKEEIEVIVDSALLLASLFAFYIIAYILM